MKKNFIWNEHSKFFTFLLRWGTFSHIISTTTLKNNANKSEDAVDSHTLDICNALQMGESTSHLESDNRFGDRRGTVHNIAANLRNNGGQGANLDLEKEFKTRLRLMSKWQQKLRYRLAYELKMIQFQVQNQWQTVPTVIWEDYPCIQELLKPTAIRETFIWEVIT